MLTKFTLKFRGRLKDAIGIRYWITDTVEAEDFDKAALALYKKYDHIGEVKDMRYYGYCGVCGKEFHVEKLSTDAVCQRCLDKEREEKQAYMERA